MRKVFVFCVLTCVLKATFDFVVIMAEVDFFKTNSKNKNTTKATTAAWNNYIRWAEKTGSPTNLTEMDKVALNAVLEQFFAETV